MDNEILEYLKSLARKKAHTDREDFMVDDCAGGNVDDAYYAGCDDGEILLAREILGKMGLTF